MRSVVTRFSVGSDRRFSASSTKLIAVTTHTVVAIASTHQKSEVAGPNAGPPISAPRCAAKNSIRAAVKISSIMMPMAPKTRPDIARDLSSVDRNRQSEQAQSAHMNSAASDTRMVTKSMPPSRKLIAMNGAIAENSVISLTPWASSLPTTTRRGDSAVRVIRSSVCSMRSVRSALNAPSGTTPRPTKPRHPISAKNVQRPAPVPPASASAAPKNATATPDTRLATNE